MGACIPFGLHSISDLAKHCSLSAAKLPSFCEILCSFGVGFFLSYSFRFLLFFVCSCILYFVYIFCCFLLSFCVFRFFYFIPCFFFPLIFFPPSSVYIYISLCCVRMGCTLTFSITIVINIL